MPLQIYQAHNGRQGGHPWHMSEEDAAFYKDAEKIEGTLAVSEAGSTGSLMRSPKKSEAANPLSVHGMPSAWSISPTTRTLL